MPTPKVVRYQVNIDAGRARGDGDIPALLDMLRYEGGRVVDWDRIGATAADYRVVIETPLTQHQPERWRSFGIVPVEVSVR